MSQHVFGKDAVQVVTAAVGIGVITKSGNLAEELKHKELFDAVEAIIDNPIDAWDIIKQTQSDEVLNAVVDRIGKSQFFKEVVGKGREFEELCLNQLKNKSSKVYTELKNKITDLDERTILAGVELCLSGKHPCNGAGEYFKPDFVAVKKIMRGGEETLDVIIIDSKLSKASLWTTNQKEAQEIFDYVVKVPGEKLQGNIDLIKESNIERNNPFVKIFKENEVIKVD